MSGSGRKTHLVVREWWEALPDVRELSVGLFETLGGQPRGSGMVGTLSWMSLMGRRPFQMSVSCWVALPDVREWLGDPAECLGVVEGPLGCPEGLTDVWEWSRGSLECPGVVRRPSRMSGSGRDTLSDVRERLGGPPRCSAVVGRLSQMTERGGKPSRMSRRLRGYLGVVGRPSWMSGSGRNTLPEVLEGPLGCPGVVGGPPRYPRVVSCPPEYPGVVGRPCRMSASGGMLSWMSGSLHGCPGVFEKPSRMSGRTIQMFGRSSRMSVTVQKALPDIREALLNVQKWSRGSLGCPRVVRRPSRMSGSGRDALSDVREWLRGPPRCSGVVGRPSRLSGIGREALPDDREG